MAALQLASLIAHVRTGTVSPCARRSHAMAASSPSSPPAATPRFIDIGANLIDRMFEGEYRGKQAHPADLLAVLERAAAAGVDRVVVTAGSLEDSIEAVRLVRASHARSPRLYATVGVHPTRCLEFLPEGARSEVEALMVGHAEAGGGAPSDTFAAAEEAILSRRDVRDARDAHIARLRAVLRDAAADGCVVAVGECGLDYERLHFCPAGRFGFEAQLALCAEFGLPAFLHNRNTAGDFAAVCKARRALIPSGVVHSFDGDAAELRELLDLGLDIGLNGCSLKTAANLAVASQVPLQRLHLETDAPWCGIKRTHAGFQYVQPSAWPETKKEKWVEGSCVKDRCEPCHIVQVAQVVAGARDIDVSIVTEHAYANSLRVFFQK
ncbi:hypothetical protein AB1Y20_005953 [Prymnesium parvum]|uniref:Uncharacterized protein n=1 Tax=Prymnesium parvum TaxID=97485 RepID=A0AB34J3A6_PRYPA